MGPQLYTTQSKYANLKVGEGMSGPYMKVLNKTVTDEKTCKGSVVIDDLCMVLVKVGV